MADHAPEEEELEEELENIRACLIVFAFIFAFALFVAVAAGIPGLIYYTYIIGVAGFALALIVVMVLIVPIIVLAIRCCILTRELNQIRVAVGMRTTVKEESS